MGRRLPSAREDRPNWTGHGGFHMKKNYGSAANQKKVSHRGFTRNAELVLSARPPLLGVEAPL